MIFTYDVTCKKSVIFCQVLYRKIWKISDSCHYYEENLWSRKSQIRRLHQHKLHKKSLFLIGLKNDQITDVDDGKELCLKTQISSIYSENLKAFSKKFNLWTELSSRDDITSKIKELKKEIIWKHISNRDLSVWPLDWIAFIKRSFLRVLSRINYFK